MACRPLRGGGPGAGPATGSGLRPRGGSSRAAARPCAARVRARPPVSRLERISSQSLNALPMLGRPSRWLLRVAFAALLRPDQSAGYVAVRPTSRSRSQALGKCAASPRPLGLLGQLLGPARAPASRPRPKRQCGLGRRPRSGRSPRRLHYGSRPREHGWNLAGPVLRRCRRRSPLPAPRSPLPSALHPVPGQSSGGAAPARSPPTRAALSAGGPLPTPPFLCLGRSLNSCSSVRGKLAPKPFTVPLVRRVCLLWVQPTCSTPVSCVAAHWEPTRRHAGSGDCMLCMHFPEWE